MKNAKIMKVKVSNVPKELKIIELNPKKTYYFQEFDEKLKMIRELADENKAAYTMDIALCDYDAPDVELFQLPAYKLDRNTPGHIKTIIEHESLKDNQAEEKGVTPEILKSFMENVKESHEYDVAGNEAVKSGELKKAGLLSRLKFKSRKGKIEEEVISAEEYEEINEKKDDTLAGNKGADNIYKSEEFPEVVGLPDSHESNSVKVDAESDETENLDSVNSLVENHSDDSVVPSENQLNGDNEDHAESEVNEASVTEPEEKDRPTGEVEVTEETKIKIPTIEEIEDEFNDKYEMNAISNNLNSLEKYEKEKIEAKNPLERKEMEYLQLREEQKHHLKEQKLKQINLSLEELMNTQHVQLQDEMKAFYESNKPDYDAYIKQMTEDVQPENLNIINRLEQQLNEEILAILKSDDEKYLAEKQVKEKQLHLEKDQKLDAKRAEINKDMQILKEREKTKADNEVEQRAQLYQSEMIEDTKSQILNEKIRQLRELSWQMVDFDTETFSNLAEMRRVFEQEEIDRLRLANEKQQQEHDARQLKLDEDKAALKEKEIEHERLMAEAINNEANQVERELEIERAKERTRELELEKMKEEISLRDIASKEEANSLEKERLELERRTQESRERETDYLNDLAKKKMFGAYLEEPKQVVTETQPIKPVVENPMQHMTERSVATQKKGGPGKFVTGALLSALILTPGFLVYNQFDKNADAEKAKTELKQKNDAELKKYETLVDKGDLTAAYQVKPKNADELKKKAVDTKDYVDAVKLAMLTEDNEYLMEVYLKNGNVDDMASAYKQMTYEERETLPEALRKDMADKMIAAKRVADAKLINKSLKDDDIAKKIRQVEDTKKKQQEALNDQQMQSNQANQTIPAQTVSEQYQPVVSNAAESKQDNMTE